MEQLPLQATFQFETKRNQRNDHKNRKKLGL